MSSFHLMAKPAGPACNLRCHYCFYTEKARLFPEGQRLRMSPEVLDAYIRKTIECQDAPEITFAWQGGEPTLMGLDFFREALRLQAHYAAGKRITNSFQTNGILLNDEWAAFLAQHHFLVGLSLDGPAQLHDLYRRDVRERPTHARVMRALERLQRHRVEYNVLVSVQARNAPAPLDVYRFLRGAGVEFIQLIPIVERKPEEGARALGLRLGVPPHLEAAETETAVTGWTVKPDDWGRFLCAIFDEWVQRDVGRVFVNLFDVALSAWMGMEPSLCTFATECGQALIIEHDGEIFACDHFVYPEYRRGNILTDDPGEIVRGVAQTAFGRAKAASLPLYCRQCPYLFACHGECPKHRFLTAPTGDPGWNYLCPGYRMFFGHVDEPMKRMAALLRAGRPAADIMTTWRPPPPLPT